MKSDIYKNFTILSFDELQSTNDKAKEMARSFEVTDGHIIICDYQTNGRGRMNRRWVSDSGNLHFSLVLKPQVRMENIQQLTFLTVNSLKEAVFEIFSEKNLQNMPKISKKWPNDLLLDDKKLAGILIESEIVNEKCDFVVIGVGVNIGSHPKDVMFKATNLAELTLKADKNEVLLKFLDKFADNYRNWLDFGFSGVKNKWLDGAWKLNQEITVNLGDQKVSGVFTGIDDNGDLELKKNDGTIKISVGDVS